MFDLTLKTRRKPIRHTRHTRTGAIVPLFAVLLPLLLVFCGFAINLAYMQLISTEIKIATDASAHAGGRAMSIYQTTDAAIAQARITAQSNTVGGETLSVGVAGQADDVTISFGTSERDNNGYGMYEFTEVSKADVDSGVEQATSLAVVGHINLPLVFQTMKFNMFNANMSHFDVTRRSIATQVDRDIALVLDRSGSMLWFQDESLMNDRIAELYNTYDEIQEPGFWKYATWRYTGGRWRWRGYRKLEDIPNHWSWWHSETWKQWTDGDTTQVRRITWSEYQDSHISGYQSNIHHLYYREYPNNVIYQLERWDNENHTLGDSYSVGESAQLTSVLAQYASDYQYQYKTGNSAPRHSRWYYLDLGVTKFLDILEVTDQTELVSLVTFNSSSRLDYALQSNYDAIRNEVAGIIPWGGTAVGDGILDGLPPIISGAAARPFAAKTIVVLTDGDSNAGVDPGTAVDQIVGSNKVTIHTVTFTPGANQPAMEAVAEAGQWRHDHANEGLELVAIFEEIANNLPTILTE